MAILHHDHHSFGRRLSELIFPSQPVHSIEHLFGRTAELDRVQKALFANGRHIFIYGDRGVGKSSLAATAANQYQSADAEYIDVGCSPDATLASVIANAAYQATKSSRLIATTSESKVTAGFKYLTVEDKKCTAARDLHNELRTTSDAVELLREVAQVHSETPVIVVDEFDRLKSVEERAKFADLVKQLGDKRIPIKFIFTGVGKTLDQLLGAHASAIRQFETIELPKLSWEARWEIMLKAAADFGIEVPRDIYFRIAAICDGYPYYVHLMTEKILWSAFEDPNEIREITWDHFHSGLTDAINSISAELKRPYEIAINQRSEDYEEVLWSTADSEWLQRYLKDMYASYEHIMSDRKDRPKLDYSKYTSRIRSLRTQGCGAILLSETKPGLYSYREKMFRGYVRMQAEANGVNLAGEANQPKPKNYMKAPARASTGYFQSTVPKGVNLGRRRSADNGDEDAT